MTNELDPRMTPNREEDLWGVVRRDIMQRLYEWAPGTPFEDRVRIAEDAAREVKTLLGELQ